MVCRLLELFKPIGRLERFSKRNRLCASRHISRLAQGSSVAYQTHTLRAAASVGRQKNFKLALSAARLLSQNAALQGDDGFDEQFMAECQIKLTKGADKWKSGLLDHEIRERKSRWDTTSTQWISADETALEFEATDENADDFTLDEFDELGNQLSGVTASQQNQQEDPHEQKSVLEILANFDVENPPSPDNPEELQLWLECFSQREAADKYQSIIDAARGRNDYSSLPRVQQYIANWFPALTEEYKAQQLASISAKLYSQAGKYGPYLCAVDPSKLAIMTAHFALTATLKPQRGSDESGMSFTSLASALGENVEQEWLIYQTLYKRRQEELASKKIILKNTDASEPEVVQADQSVEVAAAVNLVAAANSPDSVEGNKDLIPSESKWAYTASHLDNYYKELTQNELSVGKRKATVRAIKRARALLKRDEEWSNLIRVKLGAVLLKALLENATVYNEEGKEEMAFHYEMRRLSSTKLQGFVTLNPNLYKTIFTDKLESLSPFTTRQKPMIVPPTPWKSKDEGGYRWLKTHLVRSHGCKAQEV
jgi:hypothetical protein